MQEFIEMNGYPDINSGSFKNNFYGRQNYKNPLFVPKCYNEATKASLLQKSKKQNE